MAAPATEDALPPSTLALHNLACLDCRFRVFVEPTNSCWRGGGNKLSSRDFKRHAVSRATNLLCARRFKRLDSHSKVERRFIFTRFSARLFRQRAPRRCKQWLRLRQRTQYQSTEMAWPALIDAHIDAASRGVAAEHYPAQLRLRTALPRLFADCQPVPPLCGALGPIFRNAPSAYFGCGHATPLHFDLLENILCVVRGRKLVTLWHPADSHLLYPMEEASEAAFSRANVYEPDLTRFPLLEEAQSARSTSSSTRATPCICRCAGGTRLGRRLASAASASRIIVSSRRARGESRRRSGKMRRTARAACKLPSISSSRLNQSFAPSARFRQASSNQQ